MHLPGPDQCPPFDLSRISYQPNPQESGFPCPKELATRAPGRFSLSKDDGEFQAKAIEEEAKPHKRCAPGPSGLPWRLQPPRGETTNRWRTPPHFTAPSPTTSWGQAGASFYPEALQCIYLASCLYLHFHFRASTWSPRLWQGAPTPTANPPDSCRHQGPSDLQL